MGLVVYFEKYLILCKHYKIWSRAQNILYLVAILYFLLVYFVCCMGILCFLFFDIDILSLHFLFWYRSCESI